MTTHDHSPASPLSHPTRRRKFIIFVRRLLKLSLVFWAPMLLFIWIADNVHDREPIYGDIAILEFLRQFASPALNSAVVAITELGSAPVVASGIVIAVAAMWKLNRHRDALFLLFSAGGTALINVLIKLGFERARPSLWEQIVNEPSYSFPSGHAMIATALALTVILLLWHTKYRWYAVVLGVLYWLSVSISRLYLGVHYPSDVVGGWCISVLWVTTLWYAFGKLGYRAPGQTPKHKLL